MASEVNLMNDKNCRIYQDCQKVCGSLCQVGCHEEDIPFELFLIAFKESFFNSTGKL